MSWTAPSRDSAVAASPSYTVILGPTAVGKTEVSIGVALMTGAEVVSADSMQVYRGMDIGTCKPTAAEMRGVPHHLIDAAEPSEAFSAARYRRLALAAIEDIFSRGRLPILVGGSGLYIRAVVDGIFDGPSADDALRARLAEVARSLGSRRLHERLERVDPLSASRIDHRNVRRVIRALEVYELTGVPLSELQTQWVRREGGWPAMVGLSRSREDLRARIEERVEGIFEAGLLEETKRLMEGDPPPAQAIGYSEAARYLNGVCSLASAVEETKKRTWRYARRQMTWFRRDDRIVWVEIRKGEAASAVAERVVNIMENRRKR